jgi:hypothetical protein
MKNEIRQQIHSDGMREKVQVNWTWGGDEPLGVVALERASKVKKNVIFNINVRLLCIGLIYTQIVIIYNITVLQYGGKWKQIWQNHI